MFLITFHCRQLLCPGTWLCRSPGYSWRRGHIVDSPENLHYSSRLSDSHHSTLSPICLVQPWRLSWFLGNPSIRKLFFSLWVMARSSREQVISTGTMVPLVMWCSISSPNWKVVTITPIIITGQHWLTSEPGLARSSLRRSPAERWTWPKCSTIREHWVPLPAPGPPSTNITLGLPITTVLKLDGSSSNLLMWTQNMNQESRVRAPYQNWQLCHPE